MATVFLVAAAAAASSVAANLIQGTAKPDSGNIDVPKSNYGVVLPQCWGTVEVAGNLLWAAKIKKKKNSKTRKNFGRFAVLFAYCPFNPAVEIELIKFNNKGVYSTITPDSNSIAASAKYKDKYLRFYLGSATQDPDPLLENAKPVSTYDHGLPASYEDRQDLLANLGLPLSTVTVPGYRKKVYIVAEDLPLIDHGNQIPRIKARIRFHDSIFLDQIVKEICLQVGLTESDIDVSELAIVAVQGFYIDRVMPAKEVIEILQKAYFFDVFRSGGKLIFSLQASTRPSLEIPLKDLAIHQLNKARPKTYELSTPFIEDLVKRVEINFINRVIGFDTDNVAAETENPNAKRRITHNLNVVISASHAEAIAHKHLHKIWLESLKLKFSLPSSYGFLEVGDRPKIFFLNALRTLELTKVKMGADRSLQCEAKLIDNAATEVINNFTSIIDTGGFNDPTDYYPITTQGDTNLSILDINLIQDSDSDYGVYVTANGGENWEEAEIYLSSDDSRYILVGSLIDAGAIGTLQSSLDENSTSFTVQLESGEFESVSTDDLSLGFNKLLVGNEIIQFQNQTPIATDTYQITDFTRGLRGTETFINSHAIGERVVLLTGTDAVIERIPLSANDLGMIRFFKALSPNQTLDEVNAIAVLIEGNDLKPYAPVNLAATVDGAGNITINWIRRDRHAGERTDYENFPLSEVREEWEIEVLMNMTVIRTINSFDSKIVYSAVEQVTDFGSIQNTITVRVYQISIDVGTGYPVTATLSPTFAPAIPVIDSFIPISGKVGDTVTVNGFGFTNAIQGRIGSISGTNLNVISDTELTFDIAIASVTDFVIVTTPNGTAASSAAFVLFEDVEAAGQGGGIFGTFNRSTELLSQGSFENFDLDVGAIVNILEISLNFQGRVRLFPTDSDRIADTEDVSVTLNSLNAVDFYFAANDLVKKFFIALILNNLDNPRTNVLYGKVFNDSGVDNNLNVAIEYFANTVEEITTQGIPFVSDHQIHHWTLDEVSGTRLDIQGSLNLSDNNGVGAQPGILGNEAVFVSSNIQYLSANGFVLPINFACSLVFSVSELSNFKTFIGQFNSTNNRNSWVMQYDPTAMSFGVVTSTDGSFGQRVVLNNTLQVEIGKRYFALFYLDTDNDQIGNVLIEIDNYQSKVKVTAAETETYISPERLLVGANDNTGIAGSFHDGTIEDIRIFNAVPSDSEIDQIYDLYQGIVNFVGISLRKINSSATAAIELRRASDDALQDIGFAGNDLDTASVTSFLAGAEGYVSKIYIQGTTEAFVQPTNSKQAKLLLDGLNDKPTLEFNGTSDYDSTLATNGGNYSFQVVFELDDLTGQGGGIGAFFGEIELTNTSYGILFGVTEDNANNLANIVFGHFKQVLSDYDRVMPLDVLGINETKIITAVRQNDDTHTLYDKGSFLDSVACADTTDLSSNTLRLGNDYYTGNRHFKGRISEVIFDLENAWTNQEILNRVNSSNDYWFEIWTPADDLSNTYFWLDGSEQNNFVDKSASALTPQNPSGGLPIYIPNALNGKSVISLNGSDQYLGYSSSIFSSIADFYKNCIIVVENPSNWSGNQRIVYWGGTDNSVANYTQVGSTGSNNINISEHQTGNFVGCPGQTGYSIYAFDLTASKSWCDGTETSNTGTTSTGSGTGASNFLIGCFANGDLLGGFGQFSELNIAAIYFGDGDRVTIEGSLAHQFGLSAQLPANHVFKDNPPLPKLESFPSSDLIYYFSLDEASGNRTSIVGSATLTDNNTVGSQVGIKNNEAVFVSANQEFLESDITTIDTTNGFSISAWIIVDNSGTFQSILGKYSTNSSRREALITKETNDTVGFLVSNDGVSSFHALSTTVLTIGTRYHIVGTYNATNGEVKIYVDGMAENTVIAGTGGLKNGSIETFKIGCSVDSVPNNNYFFDGKIDEVALYESALTPERIQRIYNNGSGRFFRY